ncbi:uncharacterized protein LOC126685985 isoform X1 [Mercurialis annua]|uniref:uncharacterized protein LOC126685985 isoform X1 n=2 Tax=Mercurialis annua TaxID=3986 RepID=UPI00215F1693|nr:uncharacterized protein LOC126685985 isoform X1 [Mercurialis annua]
MGEHEKVLPNGLLPHEAASVIRGLDLERWAKAEERTAELIACIQPNELSEERRNAVADYVQRLITKCFPCQVFTFGSVPLKTYLPDGDIDLTAFSKNQTLKDTWAHQVRDMLEKEEKNENAEFRVKEVQYIQAEVKLIKCLVENIVVDISFNQLGGLCTLCFLEEVDHLINQNHLFKKSIILIKAWCYYESRILGAHHGLISTYALETLVLYIFHVFNNSFAGPLEVLYRFLEFFSKFDWDNFCVSLWGPVLISSLPDVTAEPPRKDGGELLLSKLFLEACGAVYAVFPVGPENQGQPFMSKHFNVIDPLRVNNNLGRSVSKGNFFRIRNAFAFGAKRLARLLDCPKEDIHFEVNQFFMNTWDRHGSGQRPDAPKNDLWRLRVSPPELSHGFNNLQISSNSNNSAHESINDAASSALTVPTQSGNSLLESSSRGSEVAVVSRSQSQKTYVNHQFKKESCSNQGSHAEKNVKSFKVKPDNLASDLQGRYLFARTRSSPELTETYGEISFQGRRNRGQEVGKGQTSSARLDNNRRKNVESDTLGSQGIRPSTEDPSSIRHASSRQNLYYITAADSNSVKNSYHDASGVSATGEEFASVHGAQGMYQEEQDFVNIMASSAGLGFNGQVHLPLNLGSSHMPLPISPTVLASMGYAHRNLGAILPGNIPLMDNPWGSNMQFPQGLVSSPSPHYYRGIGLTSSAEDSAEGGNENFVSMDLNATEADRDFWHEQERGSTTSGIDLENGSFEMHQSDDKQQSTSVSYNVIPSTRISASASSSRGHQKFSKEARGSMREDHVDAFPFQENRGGEVCFDDRVAGTMSSTSVNTSSQRSKTSSESSWEGSPAKTSKSTREKRNRKTASSAFYGKGKNVSEHSSNQGDDDNKDWNPPSTVGPDMIERSIGPQSAAAVHVPRHEISGFETAHTSGSESLISMAPMLLGHGSRQRTADGSGVVPFAFYPTGPPVPFVTMLPFYNFPSETGTPDASTSQYSAEEAVDNGDSGQSFDLLEGIDQSEVLSTSTSMTRDASVEPLEHKSDILNSDFASHWQNLQYGRFCQNSRFNSPLAGHSPLMVPPVYLQGRVPWDGPGRPLSTNMNVFTQLVNYGPRIVPVAPLQSMSNRSTGVYQHYVDEIPRYRSGTGTYLPNPVSVRDRHSTNTRKGNYSYERNDHHGDREGNWNVNPKPRATGRNTRSQGEKTNSRLDRLAANDSRSDRTWGSHRHESFSSFQSQNGPIRPNSSQGGSTNMAYGMYPLPSMNPGGVSSNGPNFPPVVMLYPYDHSGGFGSPTEQLEFGSLGAVGFAGVNEASHINEGSRPSGGFDDQRFHGNSTQRSSPDQPSSPHFQRGI